MYMKVKRIVQWNITPWTYPVTTIIKILPSWFSYHFSIVFHCSAYKKISDIISLHSQMLYGKGCLII